MRLDEVQLEHNETFVSVSLNSPPIDERGLYNGTRTSRHSETRLPVLLNGGVSPVAFRNKQGKATFLAGVKIFLTVADITPMGIPRSRCRRWRYAQDTIESCSLAGSCHKVYGGVRQKAVVLLFYNHSYCVHCLRVVLIWLVFPKQTNLSCRLETSIFQNGVNI